MPFYVPSTSETPVNNFCSAVLPSGPTQSAGSVVSNSIAYICHNAKSAVTRLSQNGQIKSISVNPSNTYLWGICANSDGRIIVGSGSNQGQWYSDDDGDTWTKNASATVPNTQASGALLRGNGDVIIDLDSQNNRIYVSQDGGDTYAAFVSGGNGLKIDGNYGLIKAYDKFYALGTNGSQLWFNYSLDGINWVQDVRGVGTTNVAGAQVYSQLTRANGDWVIGGSGVGGVGGGFGVITQAEGVERILFGGEDGQGAQTIINIAELDGFLYLFCWGTIYKEIFRGSYTFAVAPMGAGAAIMGSNIKQTAFTFNGKVYATNNSMLLSTLRDN